MISSDNPTASPSKKVRPIRPGRAQSAVKREVKKPIE
jgi:hypothetical protein